MTDYVLWQRVFKNIFCFCYLKIPDTIPSRCPKNGGYLRRFGLKTGIDFPHFDLESGMVFKGATGVYELFIVSIPNE